MQGCYHLPIALEELSCGAGTVGASLQASSCFRNYYRANRDAKLQLLVGILSPHNLAAICLSLQMPLLLLILLLQLCDLCWLCSMFGDAEGAGRKKEAVKTFPSPRAPSL